MLPKNHHALHIREVKTIGLVQKCGLGTTLKVSQKYIQNDRNLIKTVPQIDIRGFEAFIHSSFKNYILRKLFCK